VLVEGGLLLVRKETKTTNTVKKLGKERQIKPA